MKAIVDFFSSYWFEIVGYTLIHSVWQGLLILVIIAVLLRSLPSKSSILRYTIATAGLFSILCASLVTIFILKAEEPGSKILTANDYQLINIGITVDDSLPLLASVEGFVENCMPLFLMLWIVGALFFVMRIFVGLAYVNRLREESIPVGNKWNSYIQEISSRLKIERVITLAESAAIDAPVVIGWAKPFILIPIGMFAGLSTAQLETIFIHELMHIRRKDYLVNLIQSFVEAVYFFNPFVWIISNIVKRERELCCDDGVVELHGNTAAYASALAALEEARVSGTALSLSLTGNKNELLKRIKRLMEKSAHHHYSDGKVIPAVLLLSVSCAHPGYQPQRDHQAKIQLSRLPKPLCRTQQKRIRRKQKHERKWKATMHQRIMKTSRSTIKWRLMRILKWKNRSKTNLKKITHMQRPCQILTFHQFRTLLP